PTRPIRLVWRIPAGTPSHINPLAGPDQPLDRVGHLGRLLFAALADAVEDVVPQHLEGHTVEGGSRRRDLGEDVDAVALVLDHLLQAALLALRPLETGEQRLLVVLTDVTVCHLYASGLAS